MFELFLPQATLRALRLGGILYIFFPQRRQDRQELQSFFCAYPKHLCVLCALARFYSFFLSQRRQGRKELRCLICSYPKHLCVLCDLARFICFYLSQRRRGRREFQCLFSFYPKHLCVLCVLARVYLFFFSRRGAGSAENFNVLFLPQTPLRALRPGESKYRWIFLYRQFRLY